MAEFGLSFKEGKEIIIKKQFSSIEEAYEYFSNIKNMPLDKFKEIFVVIECKY
tara:strand:+ start:389 stop:547 length:159 start_codon:yes stop_codon:yes gene_type:complete